MNIKARVVGKVTQLKIDGQRYYMTEEDVRRLRSEMNRCLQQIFDKRKRGRTQDDERMYPVRGDQGSS